jgi:hypothetical protein
MNKQDLYLGRFACEETYPDQELIKLPNGEFYWTLNGFDTFEMFFDKNGVFKHSVQEDIDGNIMTFTKPNGQIPEPLTSEIMAQAKGI